MKWLQLQPSRYPTFGARFSIPVRALSAQQSAAAASVGGLNAVEAMRRCLRPLYRLTHPDLLLQQYPSEARVNGTTLSQLRATVEQLGQWSVRISGDGETSRVRAEWARWRDEFARRPHQLELYAMRRARGAPAESDTAAMVASPRRFLLRYRRPEEFWRALTSVYAALNLPPLQPWQAMPLAALENDAGRATVRPMASPVRPDDDDDGHSLLYFLRHYAPAARMRRQTVRTSMLVGTHPHVSGAHLEERLYHQTLQRVHGLCVSIDPVTAARTDAAERLQLFRQLADALETDMRAALRRPPGPFSSTTDGGTIVLHQHADTLPADATLGDEFVDAHDQLHLVGDEHPRELWQRRLHGAAFAAACQRRRVQRQVRPAAEASVAQALGIRHVYASRAVEPSPLYVCQLNRLLQYVTASRTPLWDSDTTRADAAQVSLMAATPQHPFRHLRPLGILQYPLYASAAAIVEYLRMQAPTAAAAARQHAQQQAAQLSLYRTLLQRYRMEYLRRDERCVDADTFACCCRHLLTHSAALRPWLDGQAVRIGDRDAVNEEGELVLRVDHFIGR
ncbi:hypothetical protein CDCA_CDCA05G1454 [Cyanidium caldarium]|uniref:DUF4460 domain-containing protein n=1 Tax=Cyanidium caldarium TaxID=2771 RepID=A0AAV9ITE5_CYACA|nr:hypothetical protein CDCA_CDCA05G1454 [Cyanidium caldarium]|eukprot:ctg_1404.g428